MSGERYTLTVRCTMCKAEGVIECGNWAIRITGGVEIVCPKCNHRSTWVGQFGHSLETEQKIADADELGIVGEKEGGKGDGTPDV